jgi:hypothetical protein
MPLSNLKTPNGSKKTNGNADNDDVDEEESPRRRSTSRSISYADDDDDDDDEESDDDIPLAALKGSPKKKKVEAPKTKKPPAKKATKTKATIKKKAVKKKATAVKSISTSSSSGGSDSYQSASAALYGTGCAKGMLIQRLLCRWWYAITWPNPKALPEQPPAHYDPLEGFPGVYVCTEGDDVGKIKDVRDQSASPSFLTFAKKSSEELQTLLVKAISAQRLQLIEAEGKATETEKELNQMLKWCQKLKPATADKEAAKVLKASKLSLPE